MFFQTIHQFMGEFFFKKICKELKIESYTILSSQNHKIKITIDITTTLQLKQAITKYY